MEASTARSLTCPRCNLPLVRGTTHDLILQGCRRCGGIWLDLAGARRVREHISDEASQLAAEITARGTEPVATEPPIKCLICQRPLRRARVADTEIDIDRCGQHGTWYDRAELLRLVEFVEERNKQERASSRTDPVMAGAAAAGLVVAGSELLISGPAQTPSGDLTDSVGVAFRVAEGVVDVGGSLIDIADADGAGDVISGVFGLIAAILDF